MLAERNEAPKIRIKKSLETPEGTVNFEGELSQEELDLVLSVGMNFLMQQGALPFRVMDSSNAAAIVEGNETQQ